MAVAAEAEVASDVNRRHDMFISRVLQIVRDAGGEVGPAQRQAAESQRREAAERQATEEGRRREADEQRGAEEARQREAAERRAEE